MHAHLWSFSREGLDFFFFNSYYRSRVSLSSSHGFLLVAYSLRPASSSQFCLRCVTPKNGKCQPSLAGSSTLGAK